MNAREDIARILEENDPDGGAIPDEGEDEFSYWYTQADALIKAGYRKSEPSDLYLMLMGEGKNSPDQTLDTIRRLFAIPKSNKSERWTIYDTLDGAAVMEFTSWTHHNPEERAREAFAAYPRQSRLLRQSVVKYDTEEIAHKGYNTTSVDNETVSE